MPQQRPGGDLRGVRHRPRKIPPASRDVPGRHGQHAPQHRPRRHAQKVQSQPTDRRRQHGLGKIAKLLLPGKPPRLYRRFRRSLSPRLRRRQLLFQHPLDDWRQEGKDREQPHELQQRHIGGVALNSSASSAISVSPPGDAENSAVAMSNPPNL